MGERRGGKDGCIGNTAGLFDDRILKSAILLLK